MDGLLDLDELRSAISSGEVETVVTALPDLYGRLIGKRIMGSFFLDEVVGQGMHVCDYLLACDMEMDPTPGYAFASWETGYGDLCAVPDLSTLRRASRLLVIENGRVTEQGTHRDLLANEMSTYRRLHDMQRELAHGV